MSKVQYDLVMSENIFLKIGRVFEIFASEMSEPYELNTNNNPKILDSNFWSDGNLFTNSKWKEIRSVAENIREMCDYTYDEVYDGKK